MYTISHELSKGPENSKVHRAIMNCRSWVWFLILVTLMAPRSLEMASKFLENLWNPGKEINKKNLSRKIVSLLLNK
jgi:hypothetical protein